MSLFYNVMAGVLSKADVSDALVEAWVSVGVASGNQEVLVLE